MPKHFFTRPGAHPADYELAQLLDAPDGGDARVARHLAGCPRCMAVYAEFAGARAALLTEAGRAEVPAEWLTRGLAVGAGGATPSSTAAAGGARPPSTIGRRGRARRVALLAAAAALVLVVGLEGSRLWGLRRDHAALAAAFRADSYGGLLYGEGFMPAPAGLRGAALPPEAEGALARLAARAAHGPRSADEAFWLVGGFLAEDDLDNADAHLREALRRFPGDDRLLALAGTLAYKRNDLVGAGDALNEALARRRTADHLYNLALVRRAQGQSAAAEELLRELATRFPDSPVTRLAREGASRTAPGESSR